MKQRNKMTKKETLYGKKATNKETRNLIKIIQKMEPPITISIFSENNFENNFSEKNSLKNPKNTPKNDLKSKNMVKEGSEIVFTVL